MNLLLSVLEQGLIYAILALGVYITFKILDFPDMTVDSSFPLGAAVTALMIQSGLSPLLTLPAANVAGALAGAVTGFIHVRLHVGGLLSGIIVMTGLYSVNLHVAGRANVQLFSFDTMFKNSFISALPAAVQPYAPVVILALLTLVVKLLLDAYLATRSGFLLRATGDNPTLVASLAKDSGIAPSSTPWGHRYLQKKGSPSPTSLVKISGSVIVNSRIRYLRYRSGLSFFVDSFFLGSGIL